MMMDPHVAVPFLKARRDRAVATILGWAEVELDLDEETWQSLRKRVLDGVDGYHDSVLDLVKANGEAGWMRNELAEEVLQRLDRIAAAVGQ